jgi:L-alanine-DL-glutamate epimerase-like enolase superfamily enzyme
MLRQLRAVHEAWPLATPFRISRGVKVTADVVIVEIEQGTARGRGEGVPYARYGESVNSVLKQLQGMSAAIERGMTREQLQDAMPTGAARNAIDCALWDLSASLHGRPVTEQLGQGPLPRLVSALTIGLDTPSAMQAAAVQLRGAELIKVKVDATEPEAQLRAVRAGAPDARLIVDPNESWNLPILEAMQSALLDMRVEMIEQPLPAHDDDALEGFRPALTICADESCHVAADLPKLLGRYQAVNIKLDKTGGLTGALQLLEQARGEGLKIMCGCMICTSLGIAPAFHIARHSDFIDLDGPLWLKRDHPGGARVDHGKLLAPSEALWGGSASR